MLRLDLYRVFNRRRLLLWLPAIILLALFCWNEVQGDIPEKFRTAFPIAGAWTLWFPMNGGVIFNLYFILASLCVALPTCDLFEEDRRTRLALSLHLRISARARARAHYMAAFFSGALFSGIALTALVLVAFMKAPMIPVSQYHTQVFLRQGMLLPGLFFSSSGLYIALIIVRGMLFGGMLACMALSVNYWFKSLYLGLVFPFFMINLVDIIWNRFCITTNAPIDWFANLMLEFPAGVRHLSVTSSITLGLWGVFCVLTMLHASRRKELL